jgi:Na+/proline symporter
MTGTMIITSFFFMLGFQGFWVESRGGLALCLPALLAFMARWLRRTKVMTVAEFMELRFGSGRGGQSARLLAAVAAIVLQLGFIIYFTVGTGKFLAEFLDWPPELCSVGMVTIGLVYTMMSGIYGVVYTDIFQEVILFLAAGYIIFKAMFLPDAAVAIASAGPGFTQLTPNWTAEPMTWLSDPAIYQAFGICLIFWLVTQFLNGASGAGFGYMSQRFLAAADERSASLMSAEWTVLSSVRWAMVAALVVLGLSLAQSDPEVATLLRNDPEQTLPVVLNRAMPAGLKGLAVAGLIAAAMSTFDSTLNVGASYWVRDVYQRFLRPGASEKQLVRQSWIVSVVMCVVAVTIALEVDSINQIWDWIVGPLGIGLTIPLFLRWYWWRFNGWGYAAGSLAGLISAISIALIDHNLAFYETFAISAIVSLAASIIVTYATPAVDEGDLRRFYDRVRPWGLWRPAMKHDRHRKMGREAGGDLFNYAVAMIWQLCLFISAMLFVLQQWDTFYLTFSLAVVLSFVLYFTWYRSLPPFEKNETRANETLRDGTLEDPGSTFPHGRVLDVRDPD